MRLFIYYETTDLPYGGSNSFIKAFKKYLKNKKSESIQIVSDINDNYDIFFMNGCSKSASKGKRISISLKEIEKIKKYGYTSLVKRFLSKKSKKKIVYRLDGLRAIYNNEFDPMDELQLLASNLADHIIFQSKHCLDSFRLFEYNKNNYSIINNGVDQTIFNSHEKELWNKKDKLKIFSASWSTNPNKGFSTIAAFSENEQVESHFVGNWPDKIDKKNVICYPPMEQKELASHYKKCDVFLHAAKNDPCPNTVLEALSCGLPVIYHNSGGTVEIARDYGVPLPKLINNETIQATIEKIKQNYDVLVKRIADDRRKISIDCVAEKYIEVFSKVLS